VLLLERSEVRPAPGCLDHLGSDGGGILPVSIGMTLAATDGGDGIVGRISIPAGCEPQGDAQRGGSGGDQWNDDSRAARPRDESGGER
jgi:hypothetical protein